MERMVYSIQRPCMRNPPTLTHSHTHQPLSLSLSFANIKSYHTLSLFLLLSLTSPPPTFLSSVSQNAVTIFCGRTFSFRSYSFLNQIHPWRFLLQSPPLRRRSTLATSILTSPTATSLTHSPSSRASLPFASAKTPPPANPSVMATSTSFRLRTVRLASIHLSSFRFYAFVLCFFFACNLDLRLFVCLFLD